MTEPKGKVCGETFSDWNHEPDIGDCVLGHDFVPAGPCEVVPTPLSKLMQPDAVWQVEVEPGTGESASRLKLFDPDSLDRTWASAMRKIEAAGCDPATLVQIAAANLEAWRASEAKLTELVREVRAWNQEGSELGLEGALELDTVLDRYEAKL